MKLRVIWSFPAQDCGVVSMASGQTECTRSFRVDISLFLYFGPASCLPDFLVGLKEMLVHQFSDKAGNAPVAPKPQVVVGSPSSLWLPWNVVLGQIPRGLAALQEVPKHHITSCIDLLFRLQF